MTDINNIVLESFIEKYDKLKNHLKKHKWKYLTSLGLGLGTATGLNKLIRDSENYHKLKRNLKIGGAVAGTTAAGYGAYKLINHFKNNSNK